MMNETISWVLLVAICIAGYAIVSFIIDKLKSLHRNRIQQEERYRCCGGEEEGYRFKTWDSQSEEERYARMLGLKQRATVSNVKQAYHEQLAKYHPDKVNHLGEELQQIAAKRTQEIISAYEYFRKKYNIT